MHSIKIEISKFKQLKLIFLIAIFFQLGCAKTIKNKVPVGFVFPSVTGESLEKQKINLPDDFNGDALLILVGYKQKSQFDIDRWLLGLKQLHMNLRVVEVPTIRGVFPRLIKRQIDNGMRSGIPNADWASVVSVYYGSDEIAEFTGTQNALNARVLLLDSSGRVVWFHDRGYSVDKIMELNQKVLETKEGE